MKMESGEFHWSDGITFKRMGGLSSDRPDLEWGTVRVRFYKDGGKSDEIERELIIPPYQWLSIVTSVSFQGETGFTFQVQKAMHGVAGA